MKPEPTNISASVLARLKNIADGAELNFNVLLVRYVQERFLSRVVGSLHAKSLVLKDGFLLLAYNVERARPTRDSDFLGIDLSNDRKGIKQVVREIIAGSQNDGVVFLPESLRSQLIKEAERYEGVRVKLDVRIGSARINLQIDFAFGDIVSPHPLQIDYPTLLEKANLNVLSYSKESIVAEKFEAIVQLGAFNTRMKDFYDIDFLSGECDFNEETLRDAIWKTFGRRQTSLRQAVVFLESGIRSDASLMRQWGAFTTRSHLSTRLDFNEVANTIRRFLSPVLHDAVKRDSLHRRWNRNTSEWM